MLQIGSKENIKTILWEGIDKPQLQKKEMKVKENSLNKIRRILQRNRKRKNTAKAKQTIFKAIHQRLQFTNRTNSPIDKESNKAKNNSSSIRGFGQFFQKPSIPQSMPLKMTNKIQPAPSMKDQNEDKEKLID